MKKEKYMQVRLSKFRTKEYQKDQAIRLKTLKSKRARSAITKPVHYVAMANSVCGAKRIESRKRVNAMIQKQEG